MESTDLFAAADAREAASNIAEYSVAEIAGAVKRMVEDAFGHVRVRGEVSNLRRASSGHAYFKLKDSKAVLSAVCWRGTMDKLRFPPGEGLEVVCTGRLTTYPGSSEYQLVVESVEPAGAGALMALLEARKAQLAAEGLFAQERKKPRPFLPEVVGVVTSPTGAVIRDILHRIRDRFPRRVLVWPVAVQGQKAAEQIAAAIHGFNALPEEGPLPRPDVLIVARGGGSLEDLWPFNEEITVRAVAASRIPVITAVGHETDTTLVDYAADLRAPTPTAAAELAVPVRAELLAGVRQLDARLSRAMHRALDGWRERLTSLARGLGRPEYLLESVSQRLDRAAGALRHALLTGVDRQQRRLLEAASKLTSPVHRLTLMETRLRHAVERLDAAYVRQGEQRSEYVLRLAGMLEALGPSRVLERGFALVRDETGNLITRHADAGEKSVLEIQWSDGRMRATPLLPV